jgi:hypothetical protein
MVGLNACSAGKVARCFDGVAMVKLLFALIAASILFAPTAQAALSMYQPPILSVMSI